MEQLTEEKDKLSAQIESIRNNTLNAEKIANMLQHFDIVFDNAPFEKQKELLHTLIKEIRIRKSDKPDERLAEEIILHFSELDLMRFGVDAEGKKTFEVNDDMSRHIST